VSQVDGQVQVLGEQDIPRDLDAFGDGRLALESEPAAECGFVDAGGARHARLFAVVDDHPAQVCCVLHAAAQCFRAGQWQAVVGKGDASGFGQLGHGGEFRAVKPARQRSHGMQARPVRPGRGGLVEHEARDGGVVVDRAGVGHGEHGAETTMGRSCQAGTDFFLVFVSGLAQMRMDVDKRREQGQSVGVDMSGALVGIVFVAGEQGLDPAVGHEQIYGFVLPQGRADHEFGSGHVDSPILCA